MFVKSDLDAFIKTWLKRLEQIEQNAIEAVGKFLEAVEDTSQGYVPIKSRDLSNSFFSEIDLSKKNRIVGLAGYDKSGALAHYANIMHEGFWPTDYWPDSLSYLNGTAINYHDTYQPTPRSHFLLLGFTENEDLLDKLLKGIFDGV